MAKNGLQLSYQSTGAFSKLVNDYLKSDEKLAEFYNYPATLAGVNAAIENRKAFDTNRTVLVEVLQEQYKNYEFTTAQKANVDKLLQPNTFTITTAHQPNIFTGPLYFIYKILHAIKLSQTLNAALPANHFVPVYYMGSEDADLDELGFINIDGEKINWDTTQTGAVGRMNTEGLEKIIARLKNEFGHLPFGTEMVALITAAYKKENNIQEATLYLVNELFKQYGLLIIIPDNAKLKTLFHEVIKQELTTQFSHQLVEGTAAALGKNYKVQASGRALNLFYLTSDGKRERLEKSEKNYSVPSLGLHFSENEIMTELTHHPERFSANVILRGVFQETILPNLIFIGGGGEIAYWLELKNVFNAVGVPYPILVLRNSFLLKNKRAMELQKKLALRDEQLFLSALAQEQLIVSQQSQNRLTTLPEQNQLQEIYSSVEKLSAQIDVTLSKHIQALQAKALKGLQQLDKKMLRAEKRRLSDSMRQLKTLRQLLFPQNNLQERVDNFMPLYAQYGRQLIDDILAESLSLEQAFTLLELPITS